MTQELALAKINGDLIQSPRISVQTDIDISGLGFSIETTPPQDFPATEWTKNLFRSPEPGRVVLRRRLLHLRIQFNGMRLFRMRAAGLLLGVPGVFQLGQAHFYLWSSMPVTRGGGEKMYKKLILRIFYISYHSSITTQKLFTKKHSSLKVSLIICRLLHFYSTISKRNYPFHFFKIITSNHILPLSFFKIITTNHILPLSFLKNHHY